VDLRDNGGGTTVPFQALISGILNHPAINTRGRIFGLINSATDSSAGLDAAELYTTKVTNPSGLPQGFPDIVLRPTLHQVLAGADPVLARALASRPPR